jgi:predicted MFS family arabinose efflux permease
MRRAVAASLIFQSATFALLLLFGHFGPAFAALAFCSGFNYGGNFVLYAAEVAHTYGAHRVGTVYSIIYVVYCASGFLSPFIMGKSFDHLHAYTVGLIIAAAVPAAGVTAFLLFYRRPWERARL